MPVDSGILPDFLIAKLGQSGIINPFNADQVQAASYDVRLGVELLVPEARDAHLLDLAEPLVAPTEAASLTDGRGFALAPHRFVLGVTRESLELPGHIAVRIEGKSSLAKAGLQIHSAGLVAPGYRGTLTLEIANVGEAIILLRPDIAIAQLIFEQLPAACRQPYAGRYQDSQGPQGYRPERRS